MKILEFRYVNKFDPFDDTYPHWSRKYEYPTVLAEITKRLGEFKDTPKIHNTSWGFDEPHHLRFKNLLESRFFAHNVTNSDIIYSGVQNTCYHDITQPPNENFRETFDFVLNVSAVEEISGDQGAYVQNLYDQVRPGGYLIITADYPGFVVDSLLKNLSQENWEHRIQTDATKWNSHPQLNVLLLIIQKEKKEY